MNNTDLMGQLSIKKLMCFNGTEGRGFSLDLYMHDKHVAHVSDNGNGGFSFHYDWIDRKTKDLYESWIKSEAKNRGLKHDGPADMIIEMLIAEKKSNIVLSDKQKWAFVTNWDKEVCEGL